MSRFNKILALLLALVLAAPLALFAVADGDNTPEPLAVDTSTIDGTPGNGSSEGLAQAFDGNKNTKYLTATQPAEIIFALTESAVVKYYEITSADHPEWDPCEWTLYGSADGASWTAIDAQTNQDFLLTPDTNGYAVENDTAYLWYKLEITESHGEAYGFLIAVSELELFDAVPAEEEIEGIVVDLNSVTGTAGNGSSEGLVQAVDGNPNSKYLTATCPAEIIFSLKKSAVVNGYQLTCADHGEWDPKAWTLSASADGVDWTELDAQSGQDFTGGRQSTNDYWFDNETAYLWYKLEVTESHGSAFGFVIAVAELTLVYGEPEDTTIRVDASTVTGTPGNGASEGLAQMFDQNPNSKYLTATCPAEIIFSLNRSAVVNYYELSSTDHGEWDPKAWTLYGSADGSAWTAIDERENQDFEGRGTTNTYYFENADEYLWYKLEVTESHGEAFGYKVAIAEMTVDSVAVDLTTVEGSAGNGSDNYYMLFDGNAGTKYLVFRDSDADVVTVSWQMTRAIVVNAYRLTSANDADARDPKDWAFYGSNNGTSWTLLDERTDEDFPARTTPYSFQFDNETAYDWYKFEFTANNGTDPWGYNIIQLAEVELLYAEEEIVDTSVVVDLETVTCSDPVSGHEVNYLFDNAPGTKYLTQAATMFVAFALREARAVNAYTFTCANDWASRSPSAWTFYGSNDGETWVKLDERSGETPIALLGDNRYVFENTTEYLWYKLDVTRNGGNGYTGLAELKLEVTDDPAYLTVEQEIDLTSVIGPDGTSGNGLSNLFDGNRSTRYLVQNNGEAFDIVFALVTPAAIDRYAISGSKDHLERSPKTFTFYGSADGETWVELDHRDLDARTSSDKNYFCGEAYEFENNVEYSFYKLTVEAVSSGDYCGMSALAVFGGPGVAPQQPITGDIDGSGTVDITDVTALLNGLSHGETGSVYDVDGSGNVNITDVTTLLDLLV